MKFDKPVIAAIPANTPNRDLTLKTLQILEAVRQSRQWGLGNLVTGVRNIVENPNPTYRAAIQRNVDELAQAAGLFFAFSIWDEAFSGEETRDILENQLDNDIALTFRAYRHMRNSAAHFYNGKRATRSQLDYNAFDSVMQGPQPFQKVIWDADSIDIAESFVGWQCSDFFEQVATLLFGKFANDH